MEKHILKFFGFLVFELLVKLDCSSLFCCHLHLVLHHTFTFLYICIVNRTLHDFDFRKRSLCSYIFWENIDWLLSENLESIHFVVNLYIFISFLCYNLCVDLGFEYLLIVLAIVHCLIIHVRISCDISCFDYALCVGT